MSLDVSSSLPLYAKVEAALASSIREQTLRVGSQLPTEDSLIDRFQVSRPTIRKAIQNLAARGLVEIRRGKGTFVTEPKITQELTALSGFAEDMHLVGRHPTARVIDMRVVPATEPVARRLALLTGEDVVRIQRVRLADGVPMSFDETYLPLELGQKVITNDLATEPIFSLLEEKYQLRLVEAEYRLEAISAEPDVADALGIEPGSPLFLIERTSYTDDNHPVDYEMLHYRGDLTRFVTRLKRRGKP
jgi:GntR family transcriptional regulator